jgi:hypothetical protein
VARSVKIKPGIATVKDWELARSDHKVNYHHHGRVFIFSRFVLYRSIPFTSISGFLIFGLS